MSFHQNKESNCKQKFENSTKTQAKFHFFDGSGNFSCNVKSAYMPTPKLHFQEQKSPKSRTQHNFLEHISQCIPTLIE